jgi:phosphate starvation-inducible protein PhoH
LKSSLLSVFGFSTAGQIETVVLSPIHRQFISGAGDGGAVALKFVRRQINQASQRRIGGPLKIALEITPNLEPLFGTRDENLRLMEDSLGVRIDLRSDAVHVQGPDEGVARVQRIFQDFEALRRQGVNPHNGELNGMLRLVVADPATTLRSLGRRGKQRSAGVKRTVQPRSINQRKYVEAIEQNDMVFGVGPAGTGKTYLAVAMAVAAMNAKKVSRIVLVRPAVEAGERLGFLPGSVAGEGRPLSAAALRRALRSARSGKSGQDAGEERD